MAGDDVVVTGLLVAQRFREGGDNGKGQREA